MPQLSRKLTTLRVSSVYILQNYKLQNTIENITHLSCLYYDTSILINLICRSLSIITGKFCRNYD